MKKSIIILILLALSFVGSAQQKAAAEYRSYNFSVIIEPVPFSLKPEAAVRWYHRMDLYIDGKHAQTLSIGNRIDMLISWGFSVPVGSTWELVPIETYAVKGDYQINIGVMYDGFGRADAPGTETFRIYVSGIF